MNEITEKTAACKISQSEEWREFIEVAKFLAYGARRKEEEIWESLHAQANKFLVADDMEIYFNNKQTSAIELKRAYEYGAKLDFEQIQKRLARRPYLRIIEHIIETKVPVLLRTYEEVKDTFAESNAIPEASSFPACWLGVPMRLGEQVIGVVVVYHSSQEHFYNDNDKEILDALTDQAAIAIDAAQLEYRLDVLNGIGQRLTSAMRLSESDILELVAEEAPKLINTRYMTVALREEFGADIEFALAFKDGSRIIDEQELRQLRQNVDVQFIRKIMKEHRPIRFSTRADFAAACSKNGKGMFQDEALPASWLGVPMRLRDDVIGVMVFYHPAKKDVYDQDDEKILDVMSDQAAIAIENARFVRLRDEAIHRISSTNKRRDALFKFGKDIILKALQGEVEILKVIHEQAHNLMDTDNMYIALYDSATDTVHFKLAFKNGASLPISSRPAGKGRTEEIIRTGKPIFIATRKESEEWYRQEGRAEYIGDPLASWLGVPMRDSQNEVIGVVATYHPTDDYIYTRDDFAILQAMADLAAIALENAQLRDEKIAEKQLATLGTAMATLQHRISNTFDLLFPNLSRLKSRVNMEDQTIAEIVRIIEENAHTTSDIIKRIQEPLKEIDPQSVNINAVLDEVAKKAQEKWQINSIKVYLTLDDSIPIIKAPIGQIAEVFSNLIDNAYRAMRESGGQLNIASFMKEKKICVQFQDAGPGISPEVQKRLFIKPAPSKESDKKGAGLGLWLSELILKGIGGHIALVKSDSSGTTMIVQIPSAYADRYKVEERGVK